jgi:hypothetical protein
VKRVKRAALRSKPVKALGLLIIAVAVVGIVSFFADTYFFGSKGGSSDSRPRVEIENRSPQLTPLQQTQEMFEPWRLDVSSEGDANLLMLMNTGGINRSSWVVPTDSSWQVATPFEILDWEVNGQVVSVKVNNYKTYTINTGQPFILESSPGTVYAIVFSHGHGSIIQQSVNWAQAHAHKE